MNELIMVNSVILISFFIIYAAMVQEGLQRSQVNYGLKFNLSFLCTDLKSEGQSGKTLSFEERLIFYGALPGRCLLF